MDNLLGVACFCLLIQHGVSRSMQEETVVSDYTKEASGPSLDVYQQIANNIAERITSPIYRFLGYNKTEPTTTTTTTKKPWDKVEILETPTKSLTAVNNDISNDKDVEELSEEALRRSDKKPEKLTLFTNYLPLGELSKLETNDTKGEGHGDDFDDFGFDDVESDDDVRPREQGPFVFFLEIVGSAIQLLYGAVVAFFQRKPSRSD